MEWLNNLNKAIEYIEDHLDKEISFEEAACIAYCSSYYFQRMFSYEARISLSEYIRRRRMTQARFKLQRTVSPINNLMVYQGLVYMKIKKITFYH